MLQDPQVLRDRGLGNAQGHRELGDRVRTVPQPLEQGPAGPVGERVEG